MPASPFNLRSTLLAGLCASALLMGACSGADKVPAEEITVEAASLGLTSADESHLSAHFVITKRGGTETETLSLLSAAGFDNATYGERMITGSTVVYTDWTASNDEAAMRADRVEMIGLNETDGGPTLDKLVVSGMYVEGFEGEGDGRETVMDATVGNLVVVKPSAALFVDLTDIMMARDAYADGATDNFGNLDGKSEAFRAFHVEDMVVNIMEEGKNGALSLKQIIVGNDIDNGLMDAVVETLSFDWVNAETGPNGLFNLKMDGVTVLGLDTAQLNTPGMSGVGVPQGLLSGLMTGMTPSATPPYRQIDLGQVDLKSSAFDLTTEGFEADSETKGDVTELRSVLSPMIVTLKDLAGTPVAPFMDILRENGLAEISFKGSSTTTFDRKSDRVSFVDNRMEIDGGLRTRCDYSVIGLTASAKIMDASGVKPPIFDFSDTENSEAAFENYMAQTEAYSAAQAEANKVVKIEGLTCDIQDVPGNSLVERGYKVASAITGRPVPILKGGAKTAIALGSLTAQSEFQRDLMDTLGSGLIDFIDTPGQTMTITMAPEQPVSVTSLTGADGNEPSIKPLNLSVEVR
ncbi:hypothetical protein GCM10009069_20140 [Algimonas arctica]|uniref:Uncharacterized protein n=1 Tax=Algimonas arctica TaxID=1479486 RepID=A0A8J3CQL5_9PROT|nr:hypothetical protein [Algimonas arctica]GHA97075.1 hypothetical protein GCM10009069_20140 [Algimonas arctica]